VGELSIVSFLFLEVCPDSRKSDQFWTDLISTTQRWSELIRTDQQCSVLIRADQSLWGRDKYCCMGTKLLPSWVQVFCLCGRIQNVVLCGHKEIAMGAKFLPLWVHTKIGAKILPLQVHTKCQPMWVQNFCFYGHNIIASVGAQTMFAYVGTKTLPPWAQNYCLHGCTLFASVGAHKMFPYVGTKLLPPCVVLWQSFRVLLTHFWAWANWLTHGHHALAPLHEARVFSLTGTVWNHVFAIISNM
jgi:hypothetical protein